MEFTLKLIIAFLMIFPVVKTKILKCETMDFDMKNVNNPIGIFEKCDWREEFIIKEYSDSELEPFREDSIYFLTNRFEGVNCGQTANSYDLDEHSEIEIALNFDYVNFGAQLELIVVDLASGKQVIKSDINDKTNGWKIHQLYIGQIVKEAQITILAQFNVGTVFAVEYIRVVNRKINTDECNPFDILPETTTEATEIITTSIYTTLDQPETDTQTSDSITVTSDISTDPEIEDSSIITTTSTQPVDTTSPSSSTSPTIPTSSQKPSSTDSTIDDTTDVPSTRIPNTSNGQYMWLIIGIVFISLCLAIISVSIVVYLKTQSVFRQGKLRPIKTIGILPRLVVEHPSKSSHQIRIYGNTKNVKD